MLFSNIEHKLLPFADNAGSSVPATISCWR